MPPTRVSCLYVAFLLSSVCLPATVTARALPKLSRQSTTPGKAGLGWGGGGNISQFEGHEVNWYFTWSPQSWVTPPPAELEYVPQLWGNKDLGVFTSVINTTSIASDGCKNILGMNEPELAAQANLSPQDGATMWKTYLEPLRAAGVRLGSPATTSGPAGKKWLQDFFTACAGGCTVDFVALHWYGNVASEFTAYLEDFHNTFQRPIWVTEYSCQNFVNGTQCTYEEIVQFLNITQTYMDQTPWMERYAWFGAMAVLPDGVNNLTALMDPSGRINDLGRLYIGDPVTQPTPTSMTSNAPTSTSVFTTSTSILTTTTLIPTTLTSSLSTSSPIPTTSTLFTSSDTLTTITSTTSSTVPLMNSTTSTATQTSTETAYVIISSALPGIHWNSSPLAMLGVALACLLPSMI